ncbi:MAG: zinc ribbon domain-containing protein [Asgard group archaeon]|nr:zinc ribbon domain-containing protein [Asgard group archaeon]
MSNDKYCPYCGAPQEAGTKFCGSCGASLGGDLVGSSDTGVKIVSETPMQPAAQQYTYGTTPTYQSQQQYARNNATIALILGVATWVTGCFILPIIGFIFVKKAEELNEDPQMIRIARIVNWIFLVISMLGLVGMIVWIFWFGYI